MHRSVFKRLQILGLTAALLLCAALPAVGVLGEEETTLLPGDTTTSEAPSETLPTDTAPTEPVPTEPLPTQPTPPGDKELTDEELASVYELQQQKLALQQQAMELQSARQQYTDSLEDQLKQKSNLEQQIALKQKEITLNSQIKTKLTQEIDATAAQIAAAERTITDKEQQLQTQYQALRTKLRSMEKTGTGILTTMQMLVSSQNYAEYLINSKMAARISTVDQSTLTGMETELSQIRAEKARLQEQKATLEGQRRPYAEAEQALTANKDELVALRGEAEALSLQLASNITYYREQYTQVTQQQARLQAQINEIIKDTSLVGTVQSGVLHWPAPGSTIITSSYQYREAYGRWHYGVDIADWGESTGRPIVAAADGVVALTGFDAEGYGKYLMIDHGYDPMGQRILTLYAHADALYVSEGDLVFGGQTTIASMGNTGRSDGAHLHFEVRVDGTAVDPVGSGYLPTDGVLIQG